MTEINILGDFTTALAAYAAAHGQKRRAIPPPRHAVKFFIFRPDRHSDPVAISTPLAAARSVPRDLKLDIRGFFDSAFHGCAGRTRDPAPADIPNRPFCRANPRPYSHRRTHGPAYSGLASCLLSTAARPFHVWSTFGEPCSSYYRGRGLPSYEADPSASCIVYRARRSQRERPPRRTTRDRYAVGTYCSDGNALSSACSQDCRRRHTVSRAVGREACTARSLAYRASARDSGDKETQYSRDRYSRCFRPCDGDPQLSRDKDRARRCRVPDTSGCIACDQRPDWIVQRFAWGAGILVFRSFLGWRNTPEPQRCIWESTSGDCGEASDTRRSYRLRRASFDVAS